MLGLLIAAACCLTALCWLVYHMILFAQNVLPASTLWLLDKIVGKRLGGFVFIQHYHPDIKKLLGSSPNKGPILHRAAFCHGDFPFVDPELWDGPSQERMAKGLRFLYEHSCWKARLPELVHMYMLVINNKVAPWVYQDIATLILFVQFELIFNRKLPTDSAKWWLHAATLYNHAFSARKFRNECLASKYVLAVYAEAKSESWFNQMISTTGMSLQEALTVVARVWLITPLIQVPDALIPLLSLVRAHGSVSQSRLAKASIEKDWNYVHACYFEAIRVKPPTPFISRKICRPMCFAGKNYDAGTNFVINLAQIPVDAPFCPDEADHHKGERIYFGGGVRKCPAQNFSLAYIEVLLHAFFTIVVDHSDPSSQQAWERLQLSEGFVNNSHEAFDLEFWLCRWFRLLAWMYNILLLRWYGSEEFLLRKSVAASPIP